MGDHAIEPLGPFSLAAARDFAGGFPAGIGGGAATDTSLVMAFPIEPGSGDGDAWAHSAVVELRQAARDGVVRARIDTDGDEAAALRQALRSVSLDHDGSGWPEVGRRDPVIGRLQAQFEDLRPVCFYSAYEAATSFVVGQRIARAQAARVKARLAERAGDELALDGAAFRAFPRPERLLEIDEVEGLAAEKVRRLHGLAEAALDGRLDTGRLRALPPDEALAELRQLHGVGEFTAQGILLRGCGIVDELPDDALSDEVLETLYADDLARGLTRDGIVERWRPYRMWATVLLRVGWGREAGRGASYRRDRTGGREGRPAAG
jgi:DNA-3-methyladenine glycosylase II